MSDSDVEESVSDVVAEFDAASAAGLQTLLCVRPDNHPRPSTTAHAIIRTLDEVHIKP